jgi:uncharacterized RDD family membrane protein YckC
MLRDGPFDMAVTAGGLYVLARAAGREPAQVVWIGQQSASFLPMLDEQPPRGRSMWLEAAGEELVLAGLVDRQGGQQVFFRRLEGDRFGPPTWVRDHDQPLVFPSDAQLSMARYGKDVPALTMLWPRDGQWRLATVGLDGAVTSSGAVAELLGEQPTGLTARLVRYTMVALVAMIALSWVYRQREVGGQRFSLPAHLTPSAWPKRMVAFLIDAVPLTSLAAWLAGLPVGDPDRMWQLVEQAQQNQSVPAMDRAALLWLGVYLAYAIAAEKLTGATVGKRLLRMHVVAQQGQSPTWLAVAVRNLTKPVELGMVSLYLAVVFLPLPFLTRFRQRIGDMLALTAVVDRRIAPSGMLLVEPTPLEDQPPVDQPPPDQPRS